MGVNTMAEKQEKVFEEVTQGNLWMPEEKGDEIEGEVVDIKTNQFDKQQHKLKAPSGEEFIIPTYTVLSGSELSDGKLSSIKVGDYIKIIYLGDQKSKKGTLYKDFKVEKAK